MSVRENMIINKTQTFFTRGNLRSVKLKKNILASLFIRGGNILLGLISVPLSLSYLGDYKYGIWLTIGSMLDWMSFFNFGLDHGFRNKFAEALATGDHERARKYLSTTYAILGIIAAFLIVLFLIVNPFLDWTKILNTSGEYYKEISQLVLIVFGSFAIKFVIQLIKTVLIADQRPAFGNFFNFLSKLLSIIVLLILIKTTRGSLLYMGTALSLSPIVVMLTANFFFFKGKYKLYKPSLKYVDFGSLNSLMNLGVKFFVIQIAVIIMFSTDNIIISHLFGPEDVTPYQITFRYFDVITMFFAIIVSPLWSAFTEAWVKKDISWIKGIVRKLNMIWLAFLAIDVLMMVLAKPIIKLWIGDKVFIPFLLVVLMGTYVIVRAYGGIYVNFINGTGKVKLQFYTAIISAILNIPLSIFFAKTLNLGIAGVILATLVCVLYGPIIAPIQYKAIISGRAKGIWNK